jgi:putative transposase
MEMVFKYHGTATKQNEKYNGATFRFWQKTNHPIALWTPAVVQEKIIYIHENPVRAGYVLEPHEWYLSSVCPRSPIKVLSL